MTAVIENEFFIGRQPIVGRRRELFAYELLFRSGAENQAIVVDDVYATACVIKHAFSGLGVQFALGGKKGFINLSEGLLMSDAIEALPPDRVVLEILEHVQINPQMVERCRQLRRLGYRIALDDVVRMTEGMKAVLPFVTFVKIDISTMTEPEIAALVGDLRPHNLVLLAEKVETLEQYHFCRSLGFHLFQGYFFARPSILSGRSVQPSTMLLLKVFHLIAADADIEELESALRQAPDLTVRLLRMANSVAYQQINKIYSLRNAILVLGRIQISRVVQIMLFAQHSAVDLNTDPLVQTAAVRGRLMEGMADSLGLSKVRDRAFMVGILSLADSLFSQSMTDILGILNLEETLYDAIIRRDGHLGALLNLIEASEKADGRMFRSVAHNLGLKDIDLFNRWQIEAMRWASSL
jgi:EAL and modified HD-GYP domain-containing signal transduction protein